MSLRTAGTPIPTTAAPAPPPGGGPVFLPIPRREQDEDNWCWAACCEMVFHHNDINNVQQCDMATREFGADCCAFPGSSTCDRPRWPQETFNHWGISYTFSWTRASLATLQSELDANRPVEVYLNWNGPSSHVVLVIGYYANNDLHVHDPFRGEPYGGRVTYSELQTAFGLGSWDATYTNISG